MTPIEKIRLLRKLIKQGGSCECLDCVSCKIALFQEKDNSIQCRSLYERQGLIYTPDIQQDSTQVVELAISRLKAILKEEHLR